MVFCTYFKKTVFTLDCLRRLYLIQTKRRNLISTYVEIKDETYVNIDYVLVVMNT